MRVWYGVDVEHNPMFGKVMLFVESDKPDIDIVLDCLVRCNESIDGVYFGAGEIDIVDWSFIDRLNEISDAFIVCVESSIPIAKDIGCKFDFIILRLPILYVSDNIYIKYRADDCVGLLNLPVFEQTSLSTLRDNMFLGDIIVYEKSEG